MIQAAKAKANAGGESQAGRTEQKSGNQEIDRQAELGFTDQEMKARYGADLASNVKEADDDLPF